MVESKCWVGVETDINLARVGVGLRTQNCLRYVNARFFYIPKIASKDVND